MVDSLKYESAIEVASEKFPGIRFVVERMSFGRRLDLIRELKGWLGRLEFVSAGAGGQEQQWKRRCWRARSIASTCAGVCGE